MARKSSKPNNNGSKGQAARNSQRKKATRPPLIDAKATEIPPEGAKSQAENLSFLEKIQHVLNNLTQYLREFMMFKSSAIWITSFGVVLLVIVIFGYEFLRPNAPSKQALIDLRSALEQRMAKSEQNLVKISKEIAGLKPALRQDISGDINKLGKQISQQNTQMAKFTKTLEAMTQRLAVAERALQSTDPKLDKRLKQITKTLENIGTQISQFQNRAKILEAAFKTIDRKITLLETVQRQPAELKSALSNLQVEKRKIAGLALIRAAQSGVKFSDELAIYEKIAPSDPIIALLKPYAKQNLPSLEKLRTRAENLAQIKITTRPPPKGTKDGTLDKIAIWSRNLIRIRRKSDLQKTGLDQKRLSEKRRTIWTEIARKLKSGDLQNGLRLALTLPGNAEEQNWISDAENRLLVTRQIRVLRLKLDRLRPKPPATAKTR